MSCIDNIDLRFHLWSDTGILEQRTTCSKEVLDVVMSERMKDLKENNDVFRVTVEISFVGR